MFDLSKSAAVKISSNASASIASRGPRPWDMFKTLCSIDGIETAPQEGEDKTIASKREALKAQAVESFFGKLDDEKSLLVVLAALADVITDDANKEAGEDGKKRIAGLKTFRRPVRLLFSHGANMTLPALDPAGYLLTWADVLHQSPAPAAAFRASFLRASESDEACARMASIVTDRNASFNASR